MELAWTRVCKTRICPWKISWSPDATQLAMIVDDGFCILDLATGAHHYVLLPRADDPDYDTCVVSVAWHPKGTHLALELEDDGAILYDRAAHNIRTLRWPTSTGTTGLAWSPDGTTLVTAGYYGEALYLMRPFAGEAVTRLAPPDGFSCPDHVSWSPCGKKIATECGDVASGNAVYVWDNLDTEPFRMIRAPAPGTIAFIAWGDAEHLPAVCFAAPRASMKQRSVMWSAGEHTIQTDSGRTEWQGMIWGHRRSPLVLYSDGYKSHNIYDLHTHAVIATIPFPPERVNHFAAWSADGTSLAVIGEKGGVYTCRIPDTNTLAQDVQALALDKS